MVNDLAGWLVQSGNMQAEHVYSYRSGTLNIAMPDAPASIVVHLYTVFEDWLQQNPSIRDICEPLYQRAMGVYIEGSSSVRSTLSQSIRYDIYRANTGEQNFTAYLYLFVFLPQFFKNENDLEQARKAYTSAIITFLNDR